LRRESRLRSSMSRIRIAVAFALVLVVAVVGVGAASAAPPKLVGVVGPDSSFAITLKQGSKAVKTLKAGKYTFVIKDTADIHNFHLTGPGVNKSTPVGGKGTFTWKVTLKKGKYTYICDPHASSMKGSFTVR
jgi:plastocyanin